MNRKTGHEIHRHLNREIYLTECDKKTRQQLCDVCFKKVSKKQKKNSERERLAKCLIKSTVKNFHLEHEGAKFDEVVLLKNSQRSGLCNKVGLDNTEEEYV